MFKCYVCYVLFNNELNNLSAIKWKAKKAHSLPNNRKVWGGRVKDRLLISRDK